MSVDVAEAGSVAGFGQALGRTLGLARRNYPDLSLTELVSLAAIARQPGLTMSSLAAICGYTCATASRTVHGMADSDASGALPPARGLVRVMRGPTDDRSRHVFLTHKGEEFCLGLASALTG